jgi:hypothetical protein
VSISNPFAHHDRDDAVVIAKLNELIAVVNKQGAFMSQLNDAVTSLTTSLNSGLDTLGADIAVEIAAVSAKIADAPDTTAATDALSALSVSIGERLSGFSKTIEAETAKLAPAAKPTPAPAAPAATPGVKA